MALIKQFTIGNTDYVGEYWRVNNIVYNRITNKVSIKYVLSLYKNKSAAKNDRDPITQRIRLLSISYNDFIKESEKYFDPTWFYTYIKEPEYEKIYKIDDSGKYILDDKNERTFELIDNNFFTDSINDI